MSCLEDLKDTSPGENEVPGTYHARRLVGLLARYVTMSRFYKWNPVRVREAAADTRSKWNGQRALFYK